MPYYGVDIGGKRAGGSDPPELVLALEKKVLRVLAHGVGLDRGQSP